MQKYLKTRRLSPPARKWRAGGRRVKAGSCQNGNSFTRCGCTDPIMLYFIESKISRTFLSNPSRVNGFSRKAQPRSQGSPSFSYPLNGKIEPSWYPDVKSTLVSGLTALIFSARTGPLNPGMTTSVIIKGSGPRYSVAIRRASDGSPESSTVYPESSRSRRVSPRRGAASSTSRIVSVPPSNGFAFARCTAMETASHRGK